MERLSMSTVKEVLRLKYLGDLSNRGIELLGIASKSAFSILPSISSRLILKQSKALGMEKQQLLALLFPELKRYRFKTDIPHPNGYDYSPFKEYYRVHLATSHPFINIF